MKYEDIKNFLQRCEVHPDHQSGMITHQMLEDRLQEEIDELREYIEQRTAAEGEDTRRAWVGLTDEEINDLVHSHDDFDGLWEFTDAVESKLKEKNT